MNRDYNCPFTENIINWCLTSVNRWRTTIIETSVIRHAFVRLFSTRARGGTWRVQLRAFSASRPIASGWPECQVASSKNVDILCGFHCTLISWSAFSEQCCFMWMSQRYFGSECNIGCFWFERNIFETWIKWMLVPLPYLTEHNMTHTNRRLYLITVIWCSSDLHADALVHFFRIIYIMLSVVEKTKEVIL